MVIRLLVAALLIVFAASPGWAILRGSGGAVDECAGMIVCQNFEGTGYDNGESATWSTAGTVDPDCTATVLRGSQSVCVSGDYGAAVRSFTARSSGSLFFRYRMVDDMSSVNPFFLIFRNGGTNALTLKWNSADTITAAHGTITATSGSSYTPGTEYKFWFDWASGAGTGTLSVYISTTVTKPGSPSISIITGDHSANVDSLRLLKGSAAGTVGTAAFDQVLLDDTTIGSVQE